MRNCVKKKDKLPFGMPRNLIPLDGYRLKYFGWGAIDVVNALETNTLQASLEKKKDAFQTLNKNFIQGYKKAFQSFCNTYFFRTERGKSGGKCGFFRYTVEVTHQRNYALVVIPKVDDSPEEVSEEVISDGSFFGC